MAKVSGMRHKGTGLRDKKFAPLIPHPSYFILHPSYFILYRSDDPSINASCRLWYNSPRGRGENY
jgi:hypothetical protein